MLIFFSIESFDLRCKENHVLEMSWFDLAVKARREHDDGEVAVRERHWG